MKNFVALSLLATTLHLSAAEIVSEVPDSSIGAGYGGMSGMMMGAAAGGPIGAVVGAVGGLFGGSGVQSATRTQQRAYMVRLDSGEIRRIRSPKRMFAVGDQVKVVRGRLMPAGNDV